MFILKYEHNVIFLVTPSYQQPVAASTGLDDLLGLGFSNSTTTTTLAPFASNDILSEPILPPTPAVPLASTNNFDNLLGGLQVNSSATAPPSFNTLQPFGISALSAPSGYTAPHEVC